MRCTDQTIIAIEGIDGAGKSTLISEIKGKLPSGILLYERTKKSRLVEKILSNKFFKEHHMLQIPIYLLLSYKNYISFIMKYKKTQTIIMDRCYLSNICYFFPRALYDQKLLKKVLFWEIKIFPKKIFVLDVDPVIGQKRDNNKKTLTWLTNTRRAYLDTKNSLISDFTNIVIFEEGMTIEEKSQKIIEYIQGEIKDGN